MKVIDLIAYIRNNLSLTEKLSLFMIIGKTIANTNYTIGELYQIYSEPDGFLYIVISESESFWFQYCVWCVFKYKLLLKMEYVWIQSESLTLAFV